MATLDIMEMKNLFKLNAISVKNFGHITQWGGVYFDPSGPDGRIKTHYNVKWGLVGHCEVSWLVFSLFSPNLAPPKIFHMGHVPPLPLSYAPECEGELHHNFFQCPPPFLAKWKFALKQSFMPILWAWIIYPQSRVGWNGIHPDIIFCF